MLHQQSDFFTDAGWLDTGAVFSPCRLFRYELWRRWRAEGPLLTFIMLNPSTADEVQNDPTIERCERRARMWGFAGLRIFNLYAFRATEPKDMKAAADPFGPENLERLIKAIEHDRNIIAGWGAHGRYRNASSIIMMEVERVGRTIYCLERTKAGQPKHPLYIGYDKTPVPLYGSAPWQMPEKSADVMAA